MDKQEILKDIIDSIINQRDDEAQSKFHDYMAGVSKEVISNQKQEPDQITKKD